jgi:Fe2+ transport system protein FeoA
MNEVMPLAVLRGGEAGLVLRVGVEPGVADEARAEILDRLRAMGLCAGHTVRVLRAGARMVVCCGGTQLGLARELAAHVTVSLVAGGSDNLGAAPAGTKEIA